MSEQSPSVAVSEGTGRKRGPSLLQVLRQQEGRQSPSINRSRANSGGEGAAAASNPLYDEYAGRSNESKRTEAKSTDIDESPHLHLHHGLIVSGVDTSAGDWRERTASWLHSKYPQIFLTALLLIDVILVIVELVLQSHTECNLSIDRAACLHAPHAGANPGIEEVVINASGYFPPPGCGVFGNVEVSHAIHTAETALVWCSRAILMIFFAEICTLIVCLQRRFFTILYTLDFLVVTLSLVLSFVFDGNKQMESETALIVFLRCWRFARLLHGFGVTVHNAAHENGHGDGAEHDENTQIQAEEELLEKITPECEGKLTEASSLATWDTARKTRLLQQSHGDLAEYCRWLEHELLKQRRCDHY